MQTNVVEKKSTRMRSGQNRIDFAIEVAEQAHRGQFRKGTQIPYISHPRAVGRILSDAGCSEELVIAGLLHDTVEDTPLTLNYIRENFGAKVADIVQGCSEPDKSLAWERRKQHTVEFLKTASVEVRTVTCADKLHNLLTIIADYETIGDDVWDRFSRGKEAQEWYYRELAASLCDQPDCQRADAIFQQFKDSVETLFGTAEPQD